MTHAVPTSSILHPLAAVAVGIAVGATTSLAGADITVTFNSFFDTNDFDSFVDYDSYNVVGTLSGVSAAMTLTGGDTIYASQICLRVAQDPGEEGGRLTVGYFNPFGADAWYQWPVGGHSTGAAVGGDFAIAPGLHFTGDENVDGRIWIGNLGGWNSGSWAGTITLQGINLVAVPAPGAMALLGLAGLTGRSRRRDRGH